MIYSPHFSTDVQLVTDGYRNSGLVTVLHDGHWGVICDDHWDDVDASVVCSMLGYNGSSRATVEHHTKQPFSLDNVECVGTESRVHDCMHNDWNVHNCLAHEGAGVICSFTQGRDY